jgi:hypothetical protein
MDNLMKAHTLAQYPSGADGLCPISATKSANRVILQCRKTASIFAAGYMRTLAD